MSTEAEKKLIKARTLLVLDQPFFGTLALRLKIEPTTQVPTAATDGKSMFYNPEFIDGLSTAQTVGLMAHEVMHVALGHHWRMGKREPQRWNKAADYTINEQLVKAGMSLPTEGALLNSAYNDMSVEKIYSTLPETMDNEEGGGGWGEVLPCKDKAEAKQQKEEWKAAVSQAVQVSKGNIPGDIKRMVTEEVLDPAVPWFILLRDFVEKSAKNDYDWTRPNRRHLQRGFCLPSLISEELPEVIVAIDTSGSIDTKALNEFSSEASAVFASYDTTLRVIYCDYAVQGEEVFTKSDLPMTMHPVGGGGTCFAPVFDYINKKGYTPACVIYFTDMFGSFDFDGPEFPVMWLTKSKNKKAPFGQTVQF